MTSRAVRYDDYGEIDVLEVRDVEPPVAGADEVVVRVRATSINPGEAKIRTGALRERFPSTFPSGQGSDLAGVVESVGDGVRAWSPGDEVIGFTDERASHAELVRVGAQDLTARPAGVPWEQAGCLYVAGTTAFATVRAVGLGADDTVVVTAAAGGVGCFAVQLAARTGARVIGIAGEANHEWLAERGVVGVAHGDGVEDRIRAAAPGGVDAFIDLFGAPYVELALALGVATERIDTVADFEASARHGVKAEGNAAGGGAPTLAELAALIDTGELSVPIAATYPLERVREAFTELERGHTRGKIVLVP